MKKNFAALLALLALTYVASTLRPTRNTGAYDAASFGRLPVLVNGRVKPIDTVARTSLLMMQGRQRVTAADGTSLTPVEWMLEMLFSPGRADVLQVFEIVHPDLLALLNLSTTDGAGGKRFSAQQLSKGLSELDRQAKLADETESAVRTPFQRGTVQLRDALVLYQRLQTTVCAIGPEPFLAQVLQLEQQLPSLKTPSTSPDGAKILELSRTLGSLDQLAYFRPIPPADPAASPMWRTVGAAWNESITKGRIDPSARAWAELGRAWQDHQPETFNRVVVAFRQEMERTQSDVMTKSAVETRFNSSQPFYSSTLLYVAAFLFGVFSWLKWPDAFGRGAFALLLIAFVLTTTGIVARMWLESRPPVTSLYSSALFVGWGAVSLCLVLEYFYKNAVGSVAGGLVGFATLLVAHHLSLGGDTLEMMRAVLDSNFWLATHVVTVTVGYSASFLAGLLGLIYILRGVFTRSLDDASASALNRMMYGIVCFATFFSFVGTVLGGIWADQSWGRFWGWDPKENGALLIVAWNSIILHARWGGLVKARGLATLAIFGNVVTAWSWFGVNMLGVGLHSYGFMDSAFWWLIAFVTSQLVVILIAAVPPAKWRSFAPPARS
jgi:ABC-type transport system involved in cytochrome c biogenesis permease subunit